MARAAVWLLVLLLVGCGGGRAGPPLATRLQRTLDAVASRPGNVVRYAIWRNDGKCKVLNALRYGEVL